MSLPAPTPQPGLPPAPDTPAIHCQVDGCIATVCLHNPPRLNAMNRAMWRQLREVFQHLNSLPALRAVVVAGQGGQFCAGGDISEYPDFRFTPEGLRAFHEDEVWGGLSAVLACPVPVVAQIEGACMGAGVEIASCCDIRVAGAGARFGAPIAKLGFPMAPRELALVLREVGALTVREMLLEAAVLDAGTVQARGFVHQVVADAAVAATVAQRVQKLVRLSPLAARLNKRSISQLNQPQVPVEWSSDAMNSIVSEAYSYADHAEHQEGIAAFLQKRPASFQTL